MTLLRAILPGFAAWLGLVILFCVLGALPSAANVPGGGNSGSPVTLTREGRHVILANGIVTATIDTNSAAVVSLKYQGREMVSAAGRHTRIYFSLSGGAAYEQPSHCVYSVTQQRPDHVDISCKRVYSPGDKQPWDIDIHYVLRRGGSGLYVYAVVSHPAAYPDAVMGEWRMVWSMPNDGANALLDHIYVDDLRHWQMPSPYDFAHAEPTGIKEIVKLTTGPWAGKYDCKYMYAADLWKEAAYGFAGGTNHLGAWVVFGGHDYFNDGPTKNDLTAAASLIHIMLYAEHYNGKGFTIPHGQEWSKIYGPWLLYLNHKATGDADWADAKAQAQAEEAAWPYSWLASREYPSESGRGAVTGRLVVRDPLKPALKAAGAWVGLALPEETAGNWQFQGKDYQYWTRAGADGRFILPHVRPGAYTLYAFTTGAVGEYSHTQIVVRAGASRPLGTLTWNVPHPGRRILWEIGVPDRSAGEFRHGHTDYFTPYLFTEFPQELPNPLEYDVTRGDWAAAWNYAQTTYGDGKAGVAWKWRIHFPLSAVPQGDSTLTLAFASSDQSRLNIYVNDESAPLETIAPPNAGGNALIREAIHAKYGLSYVRIPASRLHAGNNTITLSQSSVHGGFSHFMYDYLSLEAP
ncbi:MAG: polysaccharide lyase family 4 protein [Armatimonadota bacterium]|nr:polysaccharide lyase family 4 protein [Armatimonadota bacterium]